MNRRHVAIPTADGTCDATLHTPDGSGPWPAVIMFHDAGGVRPTFVAMAERLAGSGYVVLLPNLYYRVGAFEPFDLRTVFSDEAERSRLMTLATGVTTTNARIDIAAMLDDLADEADVAGSKVGTTGYCMGGRLSLLAAGSFPGRIGAAASFHGGFLATDAPDSPHLLAPEMNATVYVAGAANDGSFDSDQAARLESALENAGVAHTVLTYPAAHGFAVPDTPTYDEAADERHWQALEELYGAALAPSRHNAERTPGGPSQVR